MRLTRRRGFSLAELLVSVAIGGFAAAVMGATLVRQQRFYSSASAIIETRSQIRDAASVLATDIRSAELNLGVPLMRDSALEIFTTIASSIACTVPFPQSFGMPPMRLASGMTLTSMLAQPDTGDIALIYTAPASAPDSGGWEAVGIAAFTTSSISTACPAGSGFTSSSDASLGKTAYALTLESSTLDPVARGAPVKFVRRVRYSFYRSSDNRWYLGYRRCNATGPSSCASIQPIAGPYDPHGGESSGVAFRYFDRNGSAMTEASDGSSLAIVEIVVRGRSARQGNLSGDTQETYRDSVIISVSPRNRFR
jgi:prepilin-type N-terminal cleavage/methylation domain-containing protein